MRRARIYHPDLNHREAVLSEDESHHARDVLRMRPGDEVELFDGAGRIAAGRVIASSREGVCVQIGAIQIVSARRPPRLSLAVCPPKGDRQQLLVEKCTELGIEAITPLTCVRSVVVAGSSLLNRWRRWAIEACKQCGRADLPRIDSPTAFADLIRHRSPSPTLAIADAGGRDPGVFDTLADCGSDDILLLIGPEGGWADEEMTAARAAGIPAVALAEDTLRIETAAIAAAAVFAARRVQEMSLQRPDPWSDGSHG
ncbi:MAG: ribosomal RNA small subunit methyltransferase E [Planctomycetota bacterium]|nr:MAG: ribosomal RNA small subunit methyltransferase E [Planctomycetota bacterium]